ncbi:MAG: hypothetical protein RLZZ196_1065 [Bacteroidota bacterium]|jgi:hypothetical protein
MKFILTFAIVIAILYSIIGWKKIFERYRMFLDKTYWTDYNTIEFAAWFAKAIIIIPGLVFGIELWYMHFLTLLTSALLIWASMRKSLPTLIAFNTIWICISLTIILRHLTF